MRFSFRIRGHEKDETIDQFRFNSVLQAIRKEIVGVEKERNGLRARCEAARCSASFAFEALDDENNAAMDKRIRALSDTLLLGERRLDELDRQSRFLSDLETEVLDFRSTRFPPHQPALNSRIASSLPNR